MCRQQLAGQDEAETCHKDWAQMDSQEKKKEEKFVWRNLKHESRLNTIGFGAKHSSEESAMSLYTNTSASDIHFSLLSELVCSNLFAVGTQVMAFSLFKALLFNPV